MTYPTSNILLRHAKLFLYLMDYGLSTTSLVNPKIKQSTAIPYH